MTCPSRGIAAERAEATGARRAAAGRRLVRLLSRAAALVAALLAGLLYILLPERWSSLQDCGVKARRRW